MNDKDIPKLTVGDNSGTQRSGPECRIVRASLAPLNPGDRALIRFKDEFSVTPFREYELVRKFFRDKWDEKTGKWCGVFRRKEALEKKGGAK